MQAARHSQSIENTVSIFGNRASLSEKVTTVQKSVAGERLRKISSNGFGEVRTIEDERGMRRKPGAYLESRFCPYLLMPNRRIFESRVWRGIPSFAAAPEGPAIRP